MISTLHEVIEEKKEIQLVVTPRLTNKKKALVAGTIVMISPAMFRLYAEDLPSEKREHLLKNIPCNVIPIENIGNISTAIEELEAVV